MWKNFDGVARTRDQTLERINALKWTDWRPQGITLHNTAAPTLAQWAESGPAHDARIRNLQSFYENEKGWHAGPHWFVSRNWINWFSNPLLQGVHSRCYNATRFGIEMVGDYNAEEFNSGDGALVRDNAVFLIAALNLKFNFDPADLTFHVECKLDNHDCPGHKVVKADVIARVREMMTTLKSAPVVSVTMPAQQADVAAAASQPKRILNITATEFGGEGDEQPAAYKDVQPGWPNRPGIALPSRFSGPRPKVRVFKGAKSILCDIVDVGPWFPSARGPEDKYWEAGARPRAESDSRTNRAGIDLTPAAAKAIGLDGKGIVDWEFAEMTPPVTGPIVPATTDAVVSDLLKRIGQLESTVVAMKTTVDHISPPPDPAAKTAPSTGDLSASIRQLLELFKVINPQAQSSTQSAPQEADQIAKLLQIIKTIVQPQAQPQADGGSPQLGQVNGALGDTLGNLLNGKKTAIGILGSLATAILSNVPAGSGLGQILATVTPASGLSGYTLPIFLAMSAWGALGKMEKWTQGAAPPPK